MRIPKIRNIETAVNIYYENIELDSSAIQNLFIPQKGSGISTAKIAALKDMAREKMKEEGIPVYNGFRVNTEAAFKAWGLDIGDLEARYRKMQKLKIGG